MLAATVNVVLPRSWLEAVGEHPWAGVLVLAAVAVLVAICSEALAANSPAGSDFSLKSAPQIRFSGFMRSVNWSSANEHRRAPCHDHATVRGLIAHARCGLAVNEYRG